MHIAGVTGITDAQRAALIALGAEEDTAEWTGSLTITAPRVSRPL
jgi:hypothetical protein